jgi:hypothetical protein
MRKLNATVAESNMTNHRVKYAALVGAFAMLMWDVKSLASPIFTLWADSSNGLPNVNVSVKAIQRPRLYADTNSNSLYFSGSSTWWSGQGWGGVDDGTAFRVWRAQLPANHFDLMPQAGAGKLSVYDMTSNAEGALLVAGVDLGTGQGEVYRFDASAQRWQRSTYSNGRGPTLTMRTILRAPDGTIWGGGQWGNIYKSTDGGRSFVGTNTGLPQDLLPTAFFPSAHQNATSAGSVFSIAIAPDRTIYAGTESAGVIRSSDGGNTWDSVDPSYHGVLGTSTTDLGYLNNVMALGARPDGSLVVCGYPDPGAPSGDWNTTGQAMYYFNPVAGSDVIGSAMPAFPKQFWNNQANLHRIVTTVNGTSFFSMDRYPDLDFPGVGGLYMSIDGVHWQPSNSGIQFPLFGSGFYHFTNSEGGVEVYGNDVYVATAEGKIFHVDVASNAIFADGFE